MSDNLKWFKVWGSITDDPDFLEMSLEDIARWVLLGAYIRKHGTAGKLETSSKILSHLLRCSETELSVTINKIHNTQITQVNCNGRFIVTFKNWYKYQVDDSSQRVSKYRANVTMQDKIRLDKIKIRKDKIIKHKNKGLEFSIPDFVNPVIWTAYLEMRQSIRKPLKTKHQYKLAIDTLQKLKSQGHNPDAVLNQSIFNSWQGLFAIKINRQTETDDERMDRLEASAKKYKEDCENDNR
ncbi:MAG: hypothetical protein Q8O68_00985 [Candidatus Daviesbacteria bacterium]|nr:hypothetical protein [Candidatus Daviesbacteria bacterium]